MRQAVIDYIGGHGMNVANMNVDVTAVKFSGDHGEADVAFAVKSAPGSPAMSISYLLEQRGSKWVVTGRKQASGMPHGGTMPGGAVNPHGEMPPAAGPNPHAGGTGGAVPSPQDLPPIAKTKQ